MVYRLNNLKTTTILTYFLKHGIWYNVSAGFFQFLLLKIIRIGCYCIHWYRKPYQSNPTFSIWLRNTKIPKNIQFSRTKIQYHLLGCLFYFFILLLFVYCKRVTFVMPYRGREKFLKFCTGCISQELFVSYKKVLFCTCYIEHKENRLRKMSENIGKRIRKLLCALKFIQLCNKQVLSICQRQTAKTYNIACVSFLTAWCCYLHLISKQQTLFLFNVQRNIYF